jgi:hypothetical protein
MKTKSIKELLLKTYNLQHEVKDKLQEHIIAEEQTKMIENDNGEQKTLRLRNKI